jgi:ubiquinone/menaquinone biosynthesis C-methylase UbiE
MNAGNEKPIGLAQQQFGAVASEYATSAVHASGPDLEALVRAAAPHPGMHVLDLGCGAGHTALALAASAASVTAVDVTPEMLGVAERLARARGASNLKFRQADAAALPFDSFSFDLVTSRYSAHHFADPTAALIEVARVLRPGGRFLLVDTVAPEEPVLDTFFNAVELLRDASHVRNCRISEWQRLFAQAGMTSEVQFRYPLELDGESWVKRMRTPEPRLRALQELMFTAPDSARETFSIRRGNPWGWTIPVALIAGSLQIG